MKYSLQSLVVQLLDHVPFVDFPLLHFADEGALHAEAFELDDAFELLKRDVGALPFLVPWLLKDLPPLLRVRNEFPPDDLVRVSDRATCRPRTSPLPFPPLPFSFFIGPRLPFCGAVSFRLILV